LNIKIDPEFASLIPPLTDEEFEGLKSSILTEGCRDALVLWNGVLIDGHNRYKICTENNIQFKTVAMDFHDRNEAMRWMIKNQKARRNLTAYALGLLQLKDIEMLSEIGREKQRSAGGDRKSQEYKEKNALCEFTQSDPAEPKTDVKKELAQRIGSGEQTASRIITVNKKIERAKAENKQIAGQRPEDLHRKLMTGETTINKAYTDIKRAEKEEKREVERQENAAKIETLHTPLEAQGLFQTIVIDPPWDWGDEGDVNQFGRAKPDYHTMPIEDIKSLPVDRISDDNCHLYLWVTNRSLPKAFDLISAWGFRYITCITWVKPSIGMGNYFRGDTEQVLFAVKGSQPLKRHDVGTHFNAQRGKGHSAKPDEFYDLVESCSYAPFIDIFGRRIRDGWSVWGENG